MAYIAGILMEQGNLHQNYRGKAQAANLRGQHQCFDAGADQAVVA